MKRTAGKWIKTSTKVPDTEGECDILIIKQSKNLLPACAYWEPLFKYWYTWDGSVYGADEVVYWAKINNPIGIDLHNCE